MTLTNLLEHFLSNKHSKVEEYKINVKQKLYLLISRVFTLRKKLVNLTLIKIVMMNKSETKCWR